MLNLFIFEITLLVLCAVLIAVLLAIMWWRIAGERVKALIAGWLALPLLWKIVLPVVFGAFVLHGSVKSNENVANVVSVANPNFQLSTGNIGIDNWQHSHNGNIQQENSTLQLQLQLTTTTTLTNTDFERGFVLTRIGTNEVFDFSAPSNAVVCADWLKFGATEDWVFNVVVGADSQNSASLRLF